MAYFVSISEQGPSWVGGRAMRDQAGWTEHAAYVNAATSAGKIILGGPLGDGRVHRALLVLNFDTEARIRSWLAEDPWFQSGVLRLLSLEPWNLIVSNERLDPVLAEITKPSDGS
jgi:uncharacterized protein YciI